MPGKPQQDFEGVNDAKTRKEVLENRIKMITDPAYIAEQNVKIAIRAEKEAYRQISTWINVNNINNPLVEQTSITLPIAKTVDENKLNEWSETLTKLGYYVRADGDMFTISLE
jgi:hypothetical protein